MFEYACACVRAKLRKVKKRLPRDSPVPSLLLWNIELIYLPPDKTVLMIWIVADYDFLSKT